MNSQEVINGDPGVQQAQLVINYRQREIAIVEQRLRNTSYRARGPLAQELSIKQAALTEAQQAYRKAANLAVRVARKAEQGQARAALTLRYNEQRKTAAAALEEEVKSATMASWAGTPEQFNAAWPAIFQDFLVERAYVDQAASRRRLPAHGAI